MKRIITLLLLGTVLILASPGTFAADVAATSAVPEGAGGISGEDAPGLLVTQTRIVFEANSHSEVLTVTNNGKTPGIYMVDIINRRMAEDGSITTVEKAEAGELFADSLLKISPKRVTLEPGKSQNIRILVRKPKGLADGEYRSHLSISANRIPSDAPAIDADEKKDAKDVAVSVQASFAITLPVIVRQGKLEATAAIHDIAVKNNAQGQQEVSFVIDRNGQKSVYGDIAITYKDTNGKEYVVKTSGGLAVYTPNPRRKVTMNLDFPKGIALGKGMLSVRYAAKESEGGAVIAEGSLTL